MSAAALQPCRLRDDPISHCLSTPRLCPRAVSSVNQSRTIQYSAQKSAIVPVRRTEYAKVQHADRLRSNLAASSSGTSDAPQANTAYLGLLFGGWYAFNIYFNTYNKQVLKVFPYPFTCTNLQFAVGAGIALFMWTFNLHRRPNFSREAIMSILPLAAVHTLGNLLTNVSLGAVAVSFTHTIKAMEPFFSVLLSAIFLGDRPTLAVVAALLPIVGGVALASASEATFNWTGFLSAMGSNVTFQSRNVFSKKIMSKNKVNIDNINLFSLITILSFFLLAPFTLLREGLQFTPDAMRAMGIVNTQLLMRKALVAGFCFHAYQQVSYMILQRVSPVTHSIGNCLKRVIVIVASVVIFQNPMSQKNILGTTIALGGVFAYSQVKRLQGKQKAA